MVLTPSGCFDRVLTDICARFLPIKVVKMYVCTEWIGSKTNVRVEIDFTRIISKDIKGHSMANIFSNANLMYREFTCIIW